MPNPKTRAELSESELLNLVLDVEGIPVCSLSLISSDLRSSSGRVLAILVLALLPSIAQAGRVGSIKIAVDGHTLLTGNTFDSGSPQPAAVWRYLTSTELRPAEGVSIPPAQSDPLRSTLRGKITIDVQYGGKAEVKELRLIRQNLTGGWTVDSEDVERIAKDIGLKNIPVVMPDSRPSGSETAQSGNPINGAFTWVLIAGVGVAVLVAAITWIAILVRRGRASRA